MNEKARKKKPLDQRMETNTRKKRKRLGFKKKMRKKAKGRKKEPLVKAKKVEEVFLKY